MHYATCYLSTEIKYEYITIYFTIGPSTQVKKYAVHTGLKSFTPILKHKKYYLNFFFLKRSAVVPVTNGRDFFGIFGKQIVWFFVDYTSKPLYVCKF
jgi:hypothetical protein